MKRLFRPSWVGWTQESPISVGSDHRSRPRSLRVGTGAAASEAEETAADPGAGRSSALDGFRLRKPVRAPKPKKAKATPSGLR